MKKNEPYEVYTYEKQIGVLHRVLQIKTFEWGVVATAEDSWNFVNNHAFTTRRFRLTKNYDTIQKNIDRAKKFFKMS